MQEASSLATRDAIVSVSPTKVHYPVPVIQQSLETVWCGPLTNVATQVTTSPTPTGPGPPIQSSTEQVANPPDPDDNHTHNPGTQNAEKECSLLDPDELGTTSESQDSTPGSTGDCGEYSSDPDFKYNPGAQNDEKECSLSDELGIDFECKNTSTTSESQNSTECDEYSSDPDFKCAVPSG